MIPMGAIPYVVGAIMVAGISASLYFKGYSSGSASRNSEIVELRAKIESAQISAINAEQRADEAAAQVKIEYRERIKTVIRESESAPKLIEVIRRETPSDCHLPPAYRELWDGPDPNRAADKGSAGTDGAPVALADAAQAAAEARKRFRANEEQLIALQNYLRNLERNDNSAN